MKIEAGKKYKVLVAAKIGEKILMVSSINNDIYKGLDEAGNEFGFEKTDVLEEMDWSLYKE